MLHTVLLLGAGYAIGRYLEGQAQGVPTEQLFSPQTFFTPVGRLHPVQVFPNQQVATAINTPLSTFFGVTIPENYWPEK
jgi:hypothetical protein